MFGFSGNRDKRLKKFSSLEHESCEEKVIHSCAKNRHDTKIVTVQTNVEELSDVSLSNYFAGRNCLARASSRARSIKWTSADCIDLPVENTHLIADPAKVHQPAVAQLRALREQPSAYRHRCSFLRELNLMQNRLSLPRLKCSSLLVASRL